MPSVKLYIFQACNNDSLSSCSEWCLIGIVLIINIQYGHHVLIFNNFFNTICETGTHEIWLIGGMVNSTCYLCVGIKAKEGKIFTKEKTLL